MRTLSLVALAAGAFCALLYAGKPIGTASATVTYSGQVNPDGGSDKIRLNIRDERGRRLCDDLEVAVALEGGESNSERAAKVAEVLAKAIQDDPCVDSRVTFSAVPPVLVLVGQSETHRIEVGYVRARGGQVQVDSTSGVAPASGAPAAGLAGAELAKPEAITFTFEGTATGTHPQGGGGYVHVEFRDTSGRTAMADVVTEAGQSAAAIADELQAALVRAGSFAVRRAAFPGGVRGFTLFATAGHTPELRVLGLHDTGLSGGMVPYECEPTVR